ncbi:hypothetical protein EMMF5_002282 [Cystobasidiomycetes sp. EMM_F5]
MLNELLTPAFAWRPCLSAGMRKSGSGRVVMTSFHFELCFVLLSYALALSNLATSTAQSTGQYERHANTSDADRKRGDERINAAADLLCQAAGVLKYLSETAIPRWESAAGGLKARTPELTKEVSSALSKLCLADAEKLAIRRLMSKSIMVAQATITPGPPLPASHPSPSLLAKLYLNVYNLYESSRALAKSVGPTTGGAQKLLNSIKRDRPALTTRGSDSEASDGIAPDFRTYMTDGRAFSSSLGYKWLGVDAGENSSNTGTALGWLVLSRNGLLALQDRSKTVLPLKKGKVERAKRKDRITEELDDIDGFIKAYKRINDTVLFQPVTPETTLLSAVPGGRSVLAIKTFSLPQAAFGSRKGGAQSMLPDLARHVSGMGLVDDGDEDSDGSEVDQPQHQSNYF